MGFIGAISYLLYPSGVPSADGYSYRIVQTVAYHGLMVAQCVFAIAYDDLDFNWKNIRNDAIAVLGMTAWAIIGNELYSGVLKTACNCVENCPHSITIYENYFNWFFVKHDCLYSIPDNIDVFISPFIMLFAIFGLCSLIRFVSIKILDYAHKK